MAAEMHAAEIRADRIGKDFGSFTALDAISLSVRRGEFLTLLGPSGSGKTTFLMVLAGFERPTRGQLTLDGSDITALPAEERAFGMVFQGYALFPHMTVARNIAFPLRVQGRSRAEVRARVEAMIAMVGLEGHAHKRPAALSGGQQQRVALARALAPEPGVMLLDEPFSALDKNLRGQMQDEVRRLHRETGATFVFVTHDQSEALALSDRIAIFESGMLRQIGRPREVYERPETRFVAEFLGDVNILPLEGLAIREGRAEGRFEGRPLRAQAPDVDAGPLLAVRPEYMSVAPAPPEGGNAMPATLGEITYQGRESRLSLLTPGGKALVVTQQTATMPESLAPGADLWVTWPEGRGLLLHDRPAEPRPGTAP
jgi:putative spermidine/putrescine transport system ATP-binding protein